MAPAAQPEGAEALQIKLRCYLRDLSVGDLQQQAVAALRQALQAADPRTCLKLLLSGMQLASAVSLTRLSRPDPRAPADLATTPASARRWRYSLAAEVLAGHAPVPGRLALWAVQALVAQARDETAEQAVAEMAAAVAALVASAALRGARLGGGARAFATGG